MTPRIIAFYLPQFHPIPENDCNWGAGFTEWTNVKKASPNFVGHFQPRIPGELGYYDLRNLEIMEKQAALAQEYGVYGFCYYYYNFSGKRVLEMPLERLLQTGKPEIPFCLCWANENWTRAWHGEMSTPILSHEYNEETNHVVISDLIRYMQHPLYIRVSGKPLLLVYRAQSIPEVRDVVRSWRAECRERGAGEVYLASVEAAELAWAYRDPREFGFDAAVEFPPHNAGASIPVPNGVLNPQYEGLVFDYCQVMKRYLEALKPNYRRFRTLILGWDNTARQQNTSAIFTGCTPEVFYVWLTGLLDQTRSQIALEDELVFINAWNEWAEGTYLEPDDRYGRQFLEAVRRSLADFSDEGVVQRMVSAIDNNASRGDVDLPGHGDQTIAARQHAGIWYLEFFRQLNDALKPKTYFEIGTNTGDSLSCFSADAVCVDPKFCLGEDVSGQRTRTLLYQMSSDEFFENYDLLAHFSSGVDIMFLDGLHLSEVLLRDFFNAERYCHDRSLIILHDCLPLNPRMAERTMREGGPEEGDLRYAWTGDVWKLLPILKDYRTDLKVRVIDCQPTGLVVIQGGNRNNHILQEEYVTIIDRMAKMSLSDQELENVWKLFPTVASRELNQELILKEFG